MLLQTQQIKTQFRFWKVSINCLMTLFTKLAKNYFEIPFLTNKIFFKQRYGHLEEIMHNNNWLVLLVVVKLIAY